MEYYIAITLFTFAAGITPGPNNIMLLASGVNHGIKKSLPHFFGICLGFPVLVAAIGFGLGIIFQQHPSLHTIIKTCGILYLLFLAWKIANANTSNAPSDVKEPISFLQAALFQWINPKAWIIAIGAISTFTVPSNITQSILIIVVVYIIMGFITMGAWLTLGVGLQKILHNDQRKKVFNISMAVLLVMSIIPMVM